MRWGLFCIAAVSLAFAGLGPALAQDQQRFTLVIGASAYGENRAELEADGFIVPAALANGMGVLAWSPLGRGVLTGKYRTGTPADSRAASPHFGDYVGVYLDTRCSRVVEAVARAAEGLQWTPLEVALTWVRDRPGVAAAIVGARTAAQLRGSLTVEECVLPAEIRAALDDVSGPNPSAAQT